VTPGVSVEDNHADHADHTDAPMILMTRALDRRLRLQPARIALGLMLAASLVLEHAGSFSECCLGVRWGSSTSDGWRAAVRCPSSPPPLRSATGACRRGCASKLILRYLIVAIVFGARHDVGLVSSARSGSRPQVRLSFGVIRPDCQVALAFRSDGPDSFDGRGSGVSEAMILSV
jgi:hypothetical protein